MPLTPIASPINAQPINDNFSYLESLSKVFINPKNLGAVGDGATDDTQALSAYELTTGPGFIPKGNYITSGSIGSPIEPRATLSSFGVSIDGNSVPMISIGKFNLKTLPKNYFFVSQDTSDRNDATTVQIQRLVNTHDGITNPKALRVISNVNVDTSQTEWAISGELNNYSNTSSSGNTAVSGVSNKHGTASVFAGHFQAKDYNIYAAATDVTPLTGIEINTPAIGLDHPTANNNLGNRRSLDVIARTNEKVAGFTDGEIGTGVVIRTDNLTKGYFRYGLVVDDVSQTSNTNVIGTAILVRTSGADGIQVKGANTDSAIRINPTTPGSYGMVIQGSYTTGALRVDTGQFIGLSTDATRKLRYNGGTDSIDFNNGLTARFSFRLNSTPVLSINNVQVLGERKTGWAAATGTATRTTFDTATVTTAQLAERVKALIDDLMSHGLIGA